VVRIQRVYDPGGEGPSAESDKTAVSVCIELNQFVSFVRPETLSASAKQHYTLYTIHHTLHTTHYTPYTTHYTPYTTHYTLYTIHHTLYTIHYTLYTIHFLYTIHPPNTAKQHYTLYTNTPYTIYTIYTHQILPSSTVVTTLHRICVSADG
jgi:hypothetical protein